MRGAVALTPQGGHTAGAQQGLNKRLLNLFSCCVWRPLALQAVAAPLRPPPAGSSRNLKVRQPGVCWRQGRTPKCGRDEA